MAKRDPEAKSQSVKHIRSGSAEARLGAIIRRHGGNTSPMPKSGAVVLPTPSRAPVKGQLDLFTGEPADQADNDKTGKPQ